MLGATQLFSAPRPANDANIREALQFVNGQRAGGGTMMAGAVDEYERARRSLDPSAPVDPERMIANDPAQAQKQAVAVTREMVNLLQMQTGDGYVFRRHAMLNVEFYRTVMIS